MTAIVLARAIFHWLACYFVGKWLARLTFRRQMGIGMALTLTVAFAGIVPLLMPWWLPIVIWTGDDDAG